MQMVSMENTTAWLYYHPLLVRYARRIINDQEAAAVLVKKGISGSVCTGWFAGD